MVLLVTLSYIPLYLVGYCLIRSVSSHFQLSSLLKNIYNPIILVINILAIHIICKTILIYTSTLNTLS